MMNSSFLKHFAATILAFFLMTACGNSQDSQGYTNISPEEVHKIVESNSEDVLIIDVRTPGEYVGDLGHIPGAILRPLQQIENWSSEFENQKDKNIIMVCRSGNRSGVASQYFAKQGFTHIQNMSGGMRAWNKNDFPVKKNAPGDASK